MISNLFTGRLARTNFLLGHIYYFLVYLIPASLLISLVGMLPGMNSTIFSLLAVVIILPAFVILVVLWASLITRRFHDLNRDGTMAFLLLVPLVNIAVFIYIVLAPGAPGKNSYGEPMHANNFRKVTRLTRI